MSYPHIATVLVFYRNAEGRTRISRGATPNGAESWSEEDWLRIVGATPFIRENWLRIEVTRERPYLRKAIDSPVYRIEKLINPPSKDNDERPSS
jgi:hypothetical protein